MRDRGNGEGGPSILGQGFNSTLNDYNGTYRFQLGNEAYKADVGWAGAYWGYNQDIMEDRWFMTGFANYNFGWLDTETSPGNYEQRATIGGLGANLRAGYRHGHTENDIVVADLLFASGDDNDLSDDKYSGVITGNTWGSPASIYISSGAYILFPHGNVVNRFVSAVNDFSNMGLGLVGGTLNYYKDLVPHKLNAKVGAAYAMSQVEPDGGGKNIGMEINGRISYRPKVYMDIELHGAYMSLGDFYDSQAVNGGIDGKPVDSWTAFIAFKWLMF